MKRSVCLCLLVCLFVGLAGAENRPNTNNAGTFLIANAFAVGTKPAAIAVGDLNNDGNLDIVTGNQGDSSIAILLGNGKGSFAPATFYLTDSAPNAVAVGDFNGDGNLDLAVATGLDIYILLGNGDGTFRVGGSYAPNTSPNHMAVADLTGNGILDIVYSSDNTFEVGVILGNGDGTFQAPSTIDAGGLGPIALGDFNGDGILDLALANDGANGKNGQLFVCLGTGTGAFGTPKVSKAFPQIFIASSLAVGDFTNDGNLDVVVGDRSADTNELLLAFGNGTGALGDFRYLSTGTVPVSAVVADVNGDGNLDLIVSNNNDEDVSILLGNGKGSFTQKANYAVGNGMVLPAAVGDFNNDGKPDLAVANYGANNIQVLLATGGGLFSDARDYRVASDTSYEVAGDFNNDGKQDLVLNSDISGLTIAFGNGNGIFQPPVAISGTSVYGPIVAVDLNGDGFLDLVTYPVLSNNVAVLMNNGDGTFAAPVTYFCGFPGPFPGSLAVGDFNNDGKPDLAVSIAGFISILLGNGDGSFQTPTPFMAGTQPQGLAVGDFNGDGQLDIAAADSGAEDIAVIFGKGDGTFGPAEIIPLSNQIVYSIVAGYFHGQSNVMDLAAVYPNMPGATAPTLVDILLNNGSGSFKLAHSYTIGSLDNGTIGMAVADFNLDGNPDIALTADGSDATVLFGDGKGDFTVTTFGFGGSLFSTDVTADFNGDGKPDLAIADSLDGYTVLLNRTK